MRSARTRWLLLTSAAAVVALGGALVVQARHHPSRNAAIVPAGAAARTSGGPSSAALRSERVVVLGDSVATATACRCRPFGELVTAAAARMQSGATLSNEARDGLTSAQLLAALRGGSPGMIRRLKAATLVTVTIGANDFDPARANDPTCGGPSNTDCYRSDIGALERTVHSVLERIRTLAPGQAKVLVTGYWNVFLDGDVGALQGATYQRTSDALTKKVNQVIQREVTLAGATYVDLYSSFKGSGDRDDTPLLADDGDHPNEAGQQVIADAVERLAGIG